MKNIHSSLHFHSFTAKKKKPARKSKTNNSQRPSLTDVCILFGVWSVSGSWSEQHWGKIEEGQRVTLPPCAPSNIHPLQLPARSCSAPLTCCIHYHLSAPLLFKLTQFPVSSAASLKELTELRLNWIKFYFFVMFHDQFYFQQECLHLFLPNLETKVEAHLKTETLAASQHSCDGAENRKELLGVGVKLEWSREEQVHSHLAAGSCCRVFFLWLSSSSLFAFSSVKQQTVLLPQKKTWLQRRESHLKVSAAAVWTSSSGSVLSVPPIQTRNTTTDLLLCTVWNKENLMMNWSFLSRRPLTHMDSLQTRSDISKEALYISGAPIDFKLTFRTQRFDGGSVLWDQNSSP